MSNNSIRWSKILSCAFTKAVFTKNCGFVPVNWRSNSDKNMRPSSFFSSTSCYANIKEENKKLFLLNLQPCFSTGNFTILEMTQSSRNINNFNPLEDNYSINY